MSLFELWFSQGICPVVGLLGHTVVLFLVLKSFCLEERVGLFYVALVAERGPMKEISAQHMKNFERVEGSMV